MIRCVSNHQQSWPCIAAGETRSLAFIDDVIADGCIRMRSETHEAIVSAHIQLNATKLILRRFCYAPKYAAKETQVLLKAHEMRYSLAKSFP